MLRGWRLRARWPAPIHPELAAHLRAGVSCSYFKFARRDSIDLLQEKRKGCAKLRRREASGERRRARTGQARKPGSKTGSQAAIRLALKKRPWGGAGHDPRGGRSRYILTGPRRSRCTKRGRDPYHDRPPPGGGPVKVYRDRPPRISRPAPPPGLTISSKKHASDAPEAFGGNLETTNREGFQDHSYELC